jgi:hypothetical protein
MGVVAGRQEADWIRADHADEYLLAAAHYLARAATGPSVRLLPPPSVSATLYCAFAAEAYVNAALIRVLGEAEYEPLSRMPVRSKYFLAPWLLAFEDRFSEGESVFDRLEELFRARNRLVHAQPERVYYRRSDEDPGPDPRVLPELCDVGKWLAATPTLCAGSPGPTPSFRRWSGSPARCPRSNHFWFVSTLSGTERSSAEGSGLSERTGSGPMRRISWRRRSWMN